MQEEADHIKDVLYEVRKALHEENSLYLKDLSNQTLHTASIVQDTDSISIAVLVYSLSKLLERKESLNIKNWNKLSSKIEGLLVLSIKAIQDKKMERFSEYLEMIRKSLESISRSIKPQIEEVMRKASINKASKIYEHGISLGQTAKLLGITEWELSQYAAQTKTTDSDYNRTLDIKKRAKMALEFFS